jgi:dihydrofolate synthase/folylpolyglutamate synthase
MNPALEQALARLDARIDWERMRDRSLMRVSLEPTRDLLERLGNPERRMRAVHVAGSKGKGSTASLIAGGLSHAGLRVALYTSPHVERINERLLLDGKPVPDELLARGLEAAIDAAERATEQITFARAATWFDVLTAAGLWVAAGEGTDWLVCECGLGGRLDSTNVLASDVCVITNIELEHTEVLGGTRELIAAEKAGILVPGADLVCGVAADDEAGRVIDARAAELGLEVFRPAHPDRIGEDRMGEVSIDERNQALARLALERLGARGVSAAGGGPVGGEWLDRETIRAARLPARSEVLSRNGIRVVLDGAHVPASVRDVLRDLGARGAPHVLHIDGSPRHPLVVVLGAARNKDLVGMLKALRGPADRLVCTSLGGDLHFTGEEIAGVAAGLDLAAETAATPGDALDRACSLAAGGGGWVLVIGSLWLAGALRPTLTQSEVARP